MVFTPETVRCMYCFVSCIKTLSSGVMSALYHRVTKISRNAWPIVYALVVYVIDEWMKKGVIRSQSLNCSFIGCIHISNYHTLKDDW